MASVGAKNRGTRTSKTRSSDGRSSISQPPTNGLARALANRIGGGAPRIVWTETGDEVLLRLDGLRATVVSGALAIELDLEADDVGRERVQIRFALGRDEQGRLVGSSDEDPGALPTKGGKREIPTLTARWGRTLQDALWAALVALVDGEAAAGAAGGIPGRAFPEIAQALRSRDGRA